MQLRVLSIERVSSTLAIVSTSPPVIVVLDGIIAFSYGICIIIPVCICLPGINSNYSSIVVKMGLISFITGYVAPMFIIISPITSYADQTYSIHRNKSSLGFSLDIPLIMLVASFLRYVSFFDQQKLAAGANLFYAGYFIIQAHNLILHYLYRRLL